jgi:hypothetical protein
VELNLPSCSVNFSFSSSLCSSSPSLLARNRSPNVDGARSLPSLSTSPSSSPLPLPSRTLTADPSNELLEEPPFGDSALTRFGYGAKNPYGPAAAAYGVNVFKPVRRVGDLLRPSMLLFPLLFPSGDLDLAGENGDGDANGEAAPAKASNPVRLVAVVGVAGCEDVRDEVNAANDD